MKNSPKLLAEFIGTFALVFIGVSAICNDAGLVGVALAHGLTIAVMVSAMGHISGGHFNPAITLGAFVGKKISLNESIRYVVAQLLGAILAAFLVKIIFPSFAWGSVKLGTPMLSSTTDFGTGVVMELILTFFLVLVVYGTVIDARAPRVGGLFIGLTITLDILAGGPLTGASMNPARAFGPALVGGYWDQHLVYWIGPLLGGALAGFVYPRWLGKSGS